MVVEYLLLLPPLFVSFSSSSTWERLRSYVLTSTRCVCFQEVITTRKNLMENPLWWKFLPLLWHLCCVNKRCKAENIHWKNLTQYSHNHKQNDVPLTDIYKCHLYRSVLPLTCSLARGRENMSLTWQHSNSKPQPFNDSISFQWTKSIHTNMFLFENASFYLHFGLPSTRLHDNDVHKKVFSL